MFASLPAIFSTISSIAQGARILIAAGKDVAPAFADIKKLVSGGKITVEELAEIRRRNDRLNAEIEAQTESGSG